MRRTPTKPRPLRANRRPIVVVLAGCNGAGKSTAAPALLRDFLNVTEFVNADAIAVGLSGFHPEGVALAAGEVMLRRLKSLADSSTSFAFETTLAGRTFAPWLSDLGTANYVRHFVFLWLPSPDMAVARVRARVKAGGHSIPEDTIWRRYQRGIDNFFGLYRPLADAWRVYDNSGNLAPRMIASGASTEVETVLDEKAWKAFQACAKGG